MLLKLVHFFPGKYSGKDHFHHYLTINKSLRTPKGVAKENLRRMHWSKWTRYGECLPAKQLFVLRYETESLSIESLSSLLSMFCSNGSREAIVSNSPLRRSRWRLDGLLLVWPSFGVGFRLHDIQNGRDLVNKFKTSRER